METEELQQAVHKHREAKTLLRKKDVHTGVCRPTDKLKAMRRTPTREGSHKAISKGMPLMEADVAVEVEQTSSAGDATQEAGQATTMVADLAVQEESLEQEAIAFSQAVDATQEEVPEEVDAVQEEEAVVAKNNELFAEKTKTWNFYL